MLDGKTLGFALETRIPRARVFTQNLAFDGRAPVLSQIGQGVDDDSIPPTHGNGNGIPEPGETVGLMLRSKNYGGGQDEGVGSSLSSDSLVVVLDSLAEVGRIPAYGERFDCPGTRSCSRSKGPHRGRLPPSPASGGRLREKERPRLRARPDDAARRPLGRAGLRLHHPALGPFALSNDLSLQPLPRGQDRGALSPGEPGPRSLAPVRGRRPAARADLLLRGHGHGTPP